MRAQRYAKAAAAVWAWLDTRAAGSAPIVPCRRSGHKATRHIRQFRRHAKSAGPESCAGLLSGEIGKLFSRATGSGQWPCARGMRSQLRRQKPQESGILTMRRIYLDYNASTLSQRS